ncbi:hypothetical protein F442_19806 [Phytophthora nicotianae P10297]|uniref:Uncharacterized protein n=1 Tax=Phytophthora nicotianae P10297 TaxID=1317064 RepID=W2Y9C3_PHYNI|nr:hypothetical protein F442_19806 [Phytophthora nicotianae P10297]
MDEAVSAREDKQTESYKVVKHLLGKFPDIASWDLHPLFDPLLVDDAKVKRDMYFLGPEAKLYHRSSRRAVRNDKQDDLIELIDWESTLEYIVTRMKQVDGHMRAKLALEQVEAKRAAFDALKDNVGSERLGESRDVLNSIISQAVDENMSKDSRTGDIELESKKAFIQVVKNNRSIINDKLLKDFNGKQGFIAIKKFEYLKGMPEDLKGFYINPIDFKLRRASDHRKSNAQERNMSWASSLELLFESAKTKEIELDISGTSLRSAAKRSLEDSAVSGIEIETKKPNLNSSTMLVDSAVNVDMLEAAEDYKRLIKDIYQQNPWLIREYLPPAVSKINRQYPPEKYYLHFDADIRKIKGDQPNLAVDPVVTSKALKLIHVSWPLTFQGVVDYLIQAVQYYKEHPDQLKAQRFEDKLQHIHDTLRRLNIVLPDTRPPLEDLEMTNDVTGRGLKGAGYQIKNLRDKDGNPIKYHSNRGYNLSQLEGTQTYSALAYKRIGTKFIHLQNLNEGLLKVVYPNRCMVGPKRKVSQQLIELIKKLVFDGNIDEPMYEALSMDDKRVFHELLRITHTQHSLRDPIKDPRDVLKQEYLKLKGEVMLGNNNPSIIRELKKVLVDMYSAKLISDEEFKEVLLVLV